MDEMNMRRTLAGLIAVLLLAVTSMAAACDLSCAFAMADSDCHSGSKPAQDSMDSMGMSGMDMPGMAMPGTADHHQAFGSGISQARTAHSSIGDVGPCERQSCEKSSFVAIKSGRSNAARVSSILAAARDSSTCVSGQIFHGARDDISRRAPSRLSPPTLVLRI